MSTVKVLAALMAAVLLMKVGYATVPRVVSYQGRLTDDNGAPLPDGSYSVAIGIWNDSASADPIHKVWKSGPVTVNTVEGLFSINLGAPPMTPLPPVVAADTNLWVGIVVGTEPEGVPRLKITSSVFSFRALYADTALYAFDAPMSGEDHGALMGLGDDDHPQYFLANGSRSLSGTVDAGFHQIRNLASGTMASDAIRYDQALKSGDAAGGDLTGTFPNPGLATGSVGSSDIANGTIVNEDISASAAIAVSKVAGTACNLTSAQSVTGTKTFSEILVGDSTFWLNSNGVQIGTRDESPASTVPLSVYRTYNTASGIVGLRTYIWNLGGGNIYGNHTQVSTLSMGAVYGGYFCARAEQPTHEQYRVGVKAIAGQMSNDAGDSYAILAYAYGGWRCYGIYASAESGVNNYAGYFSGDVTVTGNLSKPAGSFKIDHPLDPENKYLQHSFVESPDMMNVYNGNVTLDAEGAAVITLPGYFEALNREFRYQLTAIGAPGPNLYVAREVEENSFAIAGGEPGMKVSWQVTGIRKDPYAQANRIQVEVDKTARERGYYQNPEVYGLGIQYSIDRENLLEAERQARGEEQE